jgi:hypothetical protein
VVLPGGWGQKYYAQIRYRPHYIQYTALGRAHRVDGLKNM